MATEHQLPPEHPDPEELIQQSVADSVEVVTGNIARGRSTVDADPFAELARRVLNFYRRARPDKQEQLRGELGRFAPHTALEADALVAQVREYCELSCTTFPTALITAGSFEDYLVGDLGDTLGGQATSEEIAESLGFARPKKVYHGLANIRDKLQKDLLDLQTLYLEGKVNDTFVRGAGTGVFTSLEQLLEYLISFYGRWIYRDYGGEGDFISHIIENFHMAGWTWTGGEKQPNHWYEQLAVWGLRFGTEEAWSIGTRPALTIVSHLNQQLEKSPIFHNDFSAFFDRSCVLRPDQIEQLGDFYKRRKPYAHSSSVPELPKIMDLVTEALTIIDSIEAERVVPSVHVVERRITMSDGMTRLDCRDEMGRRRTYRFREPVGFLSLEECFLEIDARDRERAIRELVCEFSPVILPVDIRCRKREI